MKTRKPQRGLFARMGKHRIANLESIHGGIGSVPTGDADCTGGGTDCVDHGTQPPTMDVVGTTPEYDSCK